MVPKKLPTDARLEIVSLIFVALGKYRYRGKDFYLTRVAENMKHFIADHYKQNPVNATAGLTRRGRWTLPGAMKMTPS